MSGFGKMTLGKPGVKYGLHRPGAKPTAKPVASIFGDADEEAEEQMNVGKVLTSDKHREKMQKRAEKEMAKALAVDATIFDYDGAHDEIVADRKREEQAQASKSSAQGKKQVRYVHALLERTQERKLEDDRLFEKRLVSELKKEEEELGGSTEKFVTAAYRAQLEANKKWELEQAALDKAKAKDDVTTKADLSDFYANMLRGKNSATGGKAARGGSPPKDVVAERLKERAEAERVEQEAEEAAERSLQAAVAAAAQATKAEQDKKEAEAAGEDAPRATFMPSLADAQGARQDAGQGAEGARAEGEGGEAVAEGGGAGASGAAELEVEGGADGADAAQKEREEARKRKYEGWVATPYGYVKEKKAVDTEAPEAGQKKDEAAILSARERFLQRKALKAAK